MRVEKPMTPREQVARDRAAALAPYLIETALRVRAGKIKYSQDRVDEVYEVVAALAPLIDEADLAETDKLALNAAFSFVLRSRDSGQLTPRRMALLLGLMDATRDLLEVGLEFLAVETVEEDGAPAPAALQDHP